MDQISLLRKTLQRPDLTRGQRAVFSDMLTQVAGRGVVLSEAEERWVKSALDKPMPPSEPEIPHPAWQPMTKQKIALWVGGTAAALVVFQLALTLLLRWLGWR